MNRKEPPAETVDITQPPLAQLGSGRDTLLPPIFDTYAAYGCKVNAFGVDELFGTYEQSGFLYPAKMQRLAPFMPLVRDNWEKALSGGDLVHYTVSAQKADGGWASITSWRSTRYGWHTQHLTGHGPLASRAVMLATCACRMRNSLDTSHQNWFQRTNRFANKVFGSISNTLGSDEGWVGDHSYIGVPLEGRPAVHGGVSVRMCETHDREAIQQLAIDSRSAVFAASEELDDDDLCLDAVDELYRKVGLRRYRRVLVAEVRGHSSVAGFALVYRGPLGFSFSFLENRCDLIVSATLSETERHSVLRSLLAAAAGHYVDFPPQYIPVTIDKRHAPDLLRIGGTHIRDYAQSIWLRDGFEPWYRHVERLYDRAIQADSRRGRRRDDLQAGGRP